INCHDFASFEAAIEQIIAVDRDDELYLQYVREPNFTDSVVNPYADPANLRAFLCCAVEELPRLSLLTRVRRRAIGWLSFPGYAASEIRECAARTVKTFSTRRRKV